MSRPPIPQSGTLITTPFLYIAPTRAKGLGLFTTHAMPPNTILRLEEPLIYLSNALISGLTPASQAAGETWAPLQQYLGNLVPDMLTTRVGELPFGKFFAFIDLERGKWRGSNERSIVWTNGVGVEGGAGTVVCNMGSRVNHSCEPNASLSWCSAEEIDEACGRGEEEDGSMSEVGMMSGGLVDEVAVEGPSQHFDNLVFDAPKERMGKMMLWNHKHLDPGEEVTIDYGYSADELKKLYGFECACLACTSKYPQPTTSKRARGYGDQNKDIPPPPYDNSPGSNNEFMDAVSRTQSYQSLARLKSKGSGTGYLDDEETGGSVYLSCDETETSQLDLPPRTSANIFKRESEPCSDDDNSRLVDTPKSPKTDSWPTNSSHNDLLEATQVNLTKINNETLRLVKMSKSPTKANSSANTDTNTQAEGADANMSQNTFDTSFQTEDYDLSRITEESEFPSSPINFSNADSSYNIYTPPSPNRDQSPTTPEGSPQRDLSYLSKITEESPLNSSPSSAPLAQPPSPTKPIPPKNPLRHRRSLSPRTWIRSRKSALEPVILPPLPPLRSPETLGTLIQIQPSEKHVGSGVFALVPLRSGTQILCESPLMKLTHLTSLYRAFKHLPDPLNEVVDALPAARKSAFLSLYRYSDPDVPRPTYREIIWTNAFTVDGTAAAVFEATCRFNHACIPNCRWYWESADLAKREDEGRMMVWSTKDIAEGEELTIDYGFTADELERKYGFRCACERCQHVVAVDDQKGKRGDDSSNSGVLSEGMIPTPPPTGIARTEITRPLSSSSNSSMCYLEASPTLSATSPTPTQTPGSIPNLDLNTFPSSFPQNRSSLPRRHPETLTSLLEIRPSPLGGLGIFALQEIQPGRLLLNESPLLCYPPNTTLPTLLTLFSSLSTTDQQLINALSNTIPDSSTSSTTHPHPLPNILQSNEFLRLDHKEKGLFEATCRINHSCNPNSGWIWGARMLVRAKRVIEVGEEVTIHYGVESKEEMWKKYGFVCKCGVGCLCEDKNEGKEDEVEGDEEKAFL